MISKVYFNLNVFINNTLNTISKLNKSRKDFFVEVIFLFLSIRGHINFLQLGRFGKHSEQRFRQQFENKFNFMEFNKSLINEHASKRLAIALDPSYISKSGKSTYGLGNFWSGQAGQVKWGLEISGIAAVDLENHTAFHLDAIQTPDNKYLNENTMTLLDWYAKIITDNADTLKTMSKYHVADAYFSKRPYIDKLFKVGIFVISRFRNDADLRYLYTGGKTGKKGRPKVYAGKIKYDDIDISHFEQSLTDKGETMLCGTVYSLALKRKIKLCIVYHMSDNGKITRNLYFSIDLEQNGEEILEYYQNRFQIEFLYRDGKQFTGLNDCQARSENKLNFHFNASLSSINIAKIMHWMSVEKNERKSFSMSDIKTMYHNDLLIQRFIEVFGINANSTKNQKLVKELIFFGTIAA